MIDGNCPTVLSGRYESVPSLQSVVFAGGSSLASVVAGSKPTRSWDKPHFDDIAPRNVTATVGQTAELNCYVKHPGDRVAVLCAWRTGENLPNGPERESSAAIDRDNALAISRARLENSRTMSLACFAKKKEKKTKVRIVVASQENIAFTSSLCRALWLRRARSRLAKNAFEVSAVVVSRKNISSAPYVREPFANTLRCPCNLFGSDRVLRSITPGGTADAAVHRHHFRERSTGLSRSAKPEKPACLVFANPPTHLGFSEAPRATYEKVRNAKSARRVHPETKAALRASKAWEGPRVEGEGRGGRKFDAVLDRWARRAESRVETISGGKAEKCERRQLEAELEPTATTTALAEAWAWAGAGAKNSLALIPGKEKCLRRRVSSRISRGTGASFDYGPLSRGLHSERRVLSITWPYHGHSRAADFQYLIFADFSRISRAPPSPRRLTEEDEGDTIIRRSPPARGEMGRGEARRGDEDESSGGNAESTEGGIGFIVGRTEGALAGLNSTWPPGQGALGAGDATRSSRKVELEGRSAVRGGGPRLD
ncbi:hypothetical protein KM043_000347 [Ampulex compressa]|nr:hypothetical protein KM043_000347 [Ampulex compressa]